MRKLFILLLLGFAVCFSQRNLTKVTISDIPMIYCAEDTSYYNLVGQPVDSLQGIPLDSIKSNH